jgi:putative addiction module CopG family antidote
MNVTLSSEFEKLLKEKVQAGEYSSADDVVNAAMRPFKEREDDPAPLHRVNIGEPLPIDERFEGRLEMLLEEAEQSGEPARMTSKDWDDIERDALAALRSRKSP